MHTHTNTHTNTHTHTYAHANMCKHIQIHKKYILTHTYKYNYILTSHWTYFEGPILILHSRALLFKT